MRNLNQLTGKAQATNAAAAATLAAPGSANERYRLKTVAASYGAAPTGGLLTISSDDSGAVGPTGIALPGAGVHVLLTLPVGAAPLVLNDLDLRGYPMGSLIVNLSAGGAGIVGGVFFIATYEGA